MICCPGGDLCSLANARSVPIADAINAKFDDLDYLFDIGDISVNISGCMNSCGHHHVANIGILGVDKNSEEWYQITLGGKQGNGTTHRQGDRPSFYAEEVPQVIEALINVYIEHRTPNERFIDTVERLGIEPFKARAYAGRDKRKPAKPQPKRRKQLMPKIIKNDRIVEDAWQVLKLAEAKAAETVALPQAATLFPLAVWQARKDELLARALPSASGSTAAKDRKRSPAISQASPSSA
jgi:dissimilatory sulfite reductase (desulfoviridin) alpha/beta subunit